MKFFPQKMALRIIEWMVLICVFLASASADVQWFNLGDWGTPNNGHQESVADAMADYATTFKPEFILTLGDNFYNYGITSLNDTLIQEAWRDIYLQHSSLNIPWWITVGNHDYGGNGEEFNQVSFAAVEPLWNCPHLWYLLQRTDGSVTVDIVVIDTEALRVEVNKHDEMLSWLDKTLAASTADWCIVTGHHPIFSCSGQFGPVYPKLHEKLLPILDKHKATVDMYIAGHDHNAQHLTNMTDPDYFDYVISGNGGRSLKEADPEDENTLKLDHSIQKDFIDVAPGYSAMTATKQSLTIDFLDDNNTLVYSHTREARVNQMAEGSASFFSGTASIVWWLLFFCAQVGFGYMFSYIHN